jgi:N-acyl-D-aspartate/D-glutamate deacylase
VLDLVIQGGQVVDGTGAPRRGADVGVRDGRVVAIGKVDEPARATITADDAIVAPGFVDPHTHYDAQVFWDPGLAPSTLHGITTVVAGNCGFTLAPVAPEGGADYIMRMLSRVEGMPLTSLEQGLDWDWSSTGDFFDRVDARVAPNIGFLVGHSTLRRFVLGEAATQRQATPDEVAAMAALLRQGLAAGGLGFSSSLAEAHCDADGNPVPSRCAGTDELQQLAAVCGEFPGTVLGLAPHTSGSSFPEPVVELMIDLSVRAGRPLVWNILRAGAANADEVASKLAIGRRAAAAGGELVGLTLPVPGVTRLSLANGYVLDMIPGWERLMSGPVAERQRQLADPVRRAELGRLAARPGPRANLADWGRYVLYECFTDATRGYEGSTVAEVARREQQDPFDALVAIALADDLRTSFGPPVAPDTAADWEVRARAMRDPHMLIGASDAGAHLDMVDSFAYTTQLLARAVREQEAFSTEELVHLLTQAPARRFGIRDRGVLRPGAFADVVVFDEATVGCGPVHTRRDLPGGAARLFATSRGISHVLVNGTVIVEAGEPTGQVPGRVLRSGHDTTTIAPTPDPGDPR